MDAQNCRKVKKLIDFNKNNCSSIKSLAIKKNTKVKVRSKFMNTKLLMFVKISLASFVDDMIDVFVFPDDNVKYIFSKSNIIECYLYLILTYNGSVFLQFFYQQSWMQHNRRQSKRKLNQIKD